jgi:hypothetical protein
MGLLKDFETKNFSDQISILARIGNEKDSRYLPVLFSWYNRPIGDKPVDANILIIPMKLLPVFALKGSALIMI